MKPPCECGRSYYARGLCGSHLREWLNAKAYGLDYCGPMPRYVAPSIWTSERHAELCRLFATGMKISAIAFEMGLTKNMVSGRLYRNDMLRRGRHINLLTTAERLAALDLLLPPPGVCGCGDVALSGGRYCAPCRDRMFIRPVKRDANTSLSFTMLAEGRSSYQSKRNP